MKKEMYRTLKVTEVSIDGIVYINDEASVSRVNENIVGDGMTEAKIMERVKEKNKGFYPANILSIDVREYKCTMDESKFVKLADKIESRFVGGRTKYVTRNVHSFSVECMEYNTKEQKMHTAIYPISENNGNAKILAKLKKQHEDETTIICKVIKVIESEGLYGMTEEKFFENADVKELV